jgi:hypothetical protein
VGFDTAGALLELARVRFFKGLNRSFINLSSQLDVTAREIGRAQYHRHS